MGEYSSALLQGGNFSLPEQRWWLLLFGSFFFLTGLIGSCPIYSLFDGSTKPSELSAAP